MTTESSTADFRVPSCPPAEVGALRVILNGPATVLALATTLLMLPEQAHARLVLYQSCEYRTAAKSPCKQEYGSVAELEQYISHSTWNDASIQCRDAARAGDGKFEQALEVTQTSVVHTCIVPRTGQRHMSTAIREIAPNRLDIESYNQQQEQRLRFEMNFKPTIAVKNMCAPLTLYSMLRSNGRAITGDGSLTSFIKDFQEGRSKKYYSETTGVGAADVVSVAADYGLALTYGPGNLAAVFDTIPDAIDAGKLVAVRVADMRLLNFGNQVTPTLRDQVLKDAGVDLETRKSAEHLVRIVAVKRTPAGTVRAMAVYDPILIAYGNEPYWVEPRALYYSMMPNFFRLLGIDRTVFISEQPRQPPLMPR